MLGFIIAVCITFFLAVCTVLFGVWGFVFGLILVSVTYAFNER